MGIKGNSLDTVLRNLARVRDQERGYEEIKPLLLIPGGAMRGAAVNVGQIRALQEEGFGDVFRNMIGISSGAAVAAYFATNNRDQILRSWDLVYKCIPNYVHHGITNIGRIFDTPGIEEELRGGAYAPDLNSILESPHGLYFGVIVRKTGEFVLLRSGKDIFSKVRASMTIPWISRGKAIIDGVEYLDGGFYPIPLDEIIKEFNPTDILILSNKTQGQLDEQDALGKMLGIYIKKYPRDIRMKIARSHNQLANLSKWVDRGVNVGVLFPPETGIHGLTKNHEALRNAINVSYEDALKVIAGSPFRDDIVTEFANMARLGHSLEK